MKAAALRRAATILAVKGGILREITVGDCLELSLAIDSRTLRANKGMAFYQLLHEMGAEEVWDAPGPYVEARHCAGGTRMGADPDTSVVDGWGLAHDTPNLGVLGASVFPTVGGSNPTLTVQAVAWRTAQRIVDDWGAIAGA